MEYSSLLAVVAVLAVLIFILMKWMKSDDEGGGTGTGLTLSGVGGGSSDINNSYSGGSPPGGGGVPERQEFVRDNAAVVEGGYTTLVASSSDYFGHRRSGVQPVRKLEAASAASVDACLAACKTKLDGDVQAASLYAVAQGVSKSCQCIRVNATCSERRETSYGSARTLVRKDKKKPCGTGETFASTPTAGSSSTASCKAKKNFYFTSCSVDAIPYACTPCPVGEFRSGCGGTDHGACNPRQKCKPFETAVAPSPFEDTVCVPLECPLGSEPNNFTGSCSRCPAGKQRNASRLFDGRVVYLVFDIASGRPMYAAASDPNDFGYLETTVSNPSSTSTRVNTTSKSFSFMFKHSAPSVEEIFSATLPCGILVNSSVFPEENRFVEVVFKNKRVPALCI